MAKDTSRPVEATFQPKRQRGIQPVYSNQFLLDDVWYVTVVCPIHGLFDEEVLWAEAKTPHHAGVIADQRHAECNNENAAREIEQAGLAEIEVAKHQRDQQKINLKAAQERVAVCETAQKHDAKSKVVATQLADAERNLRRHEHGMTEVERRVKEITAENTPKKKAKR